MILENLSQPNLNGISGDKKKNKRTNEQTSDCRFFWSLNCKNLLQTMEILILQLFSDNIFYAGRWYKT